MYKIAALADLKRHVRTLGSDAFPILGAHIGDAKFQYPDLTWKVTCGMMANLVGDSGCNRDRIQFFTKLKSTCTYPEEPLFAEFNPAER